MKKKWLSCILTATMAAALLTGCGNNPAGGEASGSSSSTPQSEQQSSSQQEPSKQESSQPSGEQEVLEFYHGYYHDESEWAPAKAMRDIYDEFAAQHADGPVTFKPIATEDVQGTVDNKVAGGSYPDMIDLAGNSVSLAAITQSLLYDMKPYIDKEGIKDQVGINYTQNDVDGKIYTVHDQLLTIGFWYNQKVFEDNNAGLPDTWNSWDDFDAAMSKVREAGGDVYAYGAGQGSTRCFNAYLGATEAGQKYVSGELTEEAILSPEFEEAFKTVAALDQKNGSANASGDANDWSADFNAGKSAIFFNGVWAAGGFGESTDFQPAIYPGGVALSSAGGGITVANAMSEAKTQLAMEFVKYMTSDEVQTKIFKLVGANPCNGTLDLNKLAEGADSSTVLLAKACSQANEAAVIVPTIDATWGTDIANAIANKLVECTVSGVDVDAKFEELKSELIGLIG